MVFSNYASFLNLSNSLYFLSLPMIIIDTFLLLLTLSYHFFLQLFKSTLIFYV